VSFAAKAETPPSPRTRTPTSTVRAVTGGWDAARTAVVVAALVSGVLAVVLSVTVFSRLSINNDETVYLLQAKAFASGHLFPPAGHPASAFVPWLGVTRGDHYVLKYTPVTAGFFAVSILLTATYRTALAVLAIGLVFATFLLAKEVTGNRRTAAIAAVLLAVGAHEIVVLALLLQLPLQAREPHSARQAERFVERAQADLGH